MWRLFCGDKIKMETGDKIFWIYWISFLLISIISKIHVVIIFLGVIFGVIIAYLSIKLDSRRCDTW